MATDGTFYPTSLPLDAWSRYSYRSMYAIVLFKCTGKYRYRYSYLYNYKINRCTTTIFIVCIPIITTPLQVPKYTNKIYCYKRFSTWLKKYIHHMSPNIILQIEIRTVIVERERYRIHASIVISCHRFWYPLRVPKYLILKQQYLQIN